MRKDPVTLERMVVDRSSNSTVTCISFWTCFIIGRLECRNVRWMHDVIAPVRFRATARTHVRCHPPSPLRLTDNRAYQRRQDVVNYKYSISQLHKVLWLGPMALSNNAAIEPDVVAKGKFGLEFGDGGTFESIPWAKWQNRLPRRPAYHGDNNKEMSYQEGMQPRLQCDSPYPGPGGGIVEETSVKF